MPVARNQAQARAPLLPGIWGRHVHSCCRRSARFDRSALLPCRRGQRAATACSPGDGFHVVGADGHVVDRLWADGRAPGLVGLCELNSWGRGGGGGTQMWARGRATGRGQLASAGKLAASAAPEWARVSLLAIDPVPSELSHRSQPRFSLEARPLQQRKPYPGAVRAAWDALLCGEMAPRHRLGALTVGLFTPTSFSSGLHLVKGCR